VVELAAACGLELDDWQQYVLTRSLGERDGAWASPDVGLVVARQNGKSALLQARMLAGLFLFDEKLQIYNAHLYASSMEMFLRMKGLIQSTPEFHKRVKTYAGAHGSERIELHDGRRLLFSSRTAGTGRGFTPDAYYFDEAMMFKMSSATAMIPGLSGKSVTGSPQLWYVGSAVDQEVSGDGLILAGVRKRALAVGDPRLAYFEWSADRPTPADVAPDELLNEELLAAANPALGTRVSMDWIRGELPLLGNRGFAVERLTVGDWPDPDAALETVIDMERFLNLQDPHAQMQDPVVFAFDLSPDRSSGAIYASSMSLLGRPMVDKVKHDRGAGWIVPRVLELVDKHKPLAVACDGAGAAASLLIELEKEGVDVFAVSAAEHTKACGAFYDAVEEGRLTHTGDVALAAAIRGATTRPLGGAWAWNRRTSAADITPLVAATLALGVYREKTNERPKPAARVINLDDIDLDDETA
jgi:hypothetical protein